MSDLQHPAQAEFMASFHALLNALSLLEKFEKRTADPDALITMQQAETWLRDAWLDLSAVERRMKEQGDLLRQMTAQQQSALAAYERGWQDRLIDIITRFPGKEYAEFRALLETLVQKSG